MFCGFVEFSSHAAVEKVLQSYAGVLRPNTDQSFRLNWATFSMSNKRSENGHDLSIFVGDLLQMSLIAYYMKPFLVNIHLLRLQKLSLMPILVVQKVMALSGLEVRMRDHRS